ncbi:MAG: type II toxin-antitoxin system RelE/ParE family toxin [Sideroxyarcus sp.]|nr:type II toxin-antitoxin system RelE/ParE family toxin [Sideroxyarcus sp.]
MSFKVLLTRSAEHDLEEIYDYIAENDTQGNADHVLDKLMEAAESLAAFPERGAYPKELLVLGIREYRQAHFKPYRLIYRVIGKQVFIYMIADGRRDIQTLLSRRMLGL